MTMKTIGNGGDTLIIPIMPGEHTFQVRALA